MKTLFIFLFVVISLSQFARSQQLHIDSTRFITGTNPGTQLQSAIPTIDNGMLFVGGTDHNPRGLIPNFPIDTSGSNALICKIDSNQRISWIKVYGGSSTDGAICACQTPDSGYAILGSTASNDGNVTGFKGAIDIWLLRLDGDGNLLWENCYGSSQSDGAVSITNTLDHGFIILGTSNGSDYDVPFHYGDFSSVDWLVIKVDSNGNVQWSKDIGGSLDEGSSGSILSVDSNFYLVSWSNSRDHDCTDTAWHAGTTINNENYYVLKLDDTGRVLWDSSYGGSGGDDAVQAIYNISDSSIIISGTTTSSDYMVTGYHGGNGDMWVVKINKNGKLIWQKTLGSEEEEHATGLCDRTSAEGYLIYGSTFPHYSHDSLPGYIGGEDCWLFVLDSAGNELASKIFGGTGREEPASILPHLDGYAATGSSFSLVFTEGTTYGNFDTSSINPTGGGAFVSYLDSAGNISSVELQQHKQLLKVYPNPSASSVNITTPVTKSGTMEIVNCLGQTLYEETKIIDTNRSIATGNWADGLYVVIWKDESGNILTAKFIKD